MSLQHLNLHPGHLQTDCLCASGCVYLEGGFSLPLYQVFCFDAHFEAFAQGSLDLTLPLFSFLITATILDERRLELGELK